MVVKQDHACRESEIRAYWLNRNEGILDLLLCEKSSIICLQVPINLMLFGNIFVCMYEIIY